MANKTEQAAEYAHEQVPGEGHLLWAPDGHAPDVLDARLLAREAWLAGWAAGRTAPGRKARQEAGNG